MDPVQFEKLRKEAWGHWCQLLEARHRASSAMMEVSMHEHDFGKAYMTLVTYASASFKCYEEGIGKESVAV